MNFGAANRAGMRKERTMTVIRMGRKESNEFLEFAFDNEFEAYVFYSSTVDHYREDDLFISMTEESEEDDEDLHFGADEGVDEEALLRELLNSGTFIDFKRTRSDKSMLY